MLADVAAYAAQIGSYLQSDAASNLFTVLAIPIALYVGLVALRSYRSDKRIAANAHMHGLFQGYLTDILTEARNERERTNDREKERLDKFIAEQMAGLKLYALEEMFVWIKDQEYLHKLPSLNPFARRRRQFRRDAFDAWKATVRFHLKQDASVVKLSAEGFATCYSVEFLELVAEVLDDPELEMLARKHRMALNGKRRRPIGTIEGLPASMHERLASVILRSPATGDVPQQIRDE